MNQLAQSTGVVPQAVDAHAQEEVEKLFKRYNKQYFGDALSGYKVVASDLFRGGHWDRRIKTIFLNPCTAIPLNQLLLHEMAHAVTNDRHGEKWQSEMKRLIRRGAPVEEELAGYLRPAKPIGPSQILGDFEDAGAEGVTWPAARMSIGNENGLVDKTGTTDIDARKFFKKAYNAWRRGQRMHVRLKAKKLVHSHGKG